MFCEAVSWTPVIHINEWNAQDCSKHFHFHLIVPMLLTWAALLQLCWATMQIIGKFLYFLNVWIFTYNYWPHNIIWLSSLMFRILNIFSLSGNIRTLLTKGKETPGHIFRGYTEFVTSLPDPIWCPMQQKLLISWSRM